MDPKMIHSLIGEKILLSYVSNLLFLYVVQNTVSSPSLLLGSIKLKCTAHILAGMPTIAVSESSIPRSYPDSTTGLEQTALPLCQ